MRELLYSDDIKKVLIEIHQVMDENKDYLCKLDGAVGDGDIGLTMSKGFQAVIDNLSSIDEEDIGLILMRSGAVMAERASSTMGTLMATGLIRAGKASKGMTALGVEQLVLITKAMAEGIIQRGKAKIGDKTILDAIVPAGEAMETALKEGKTLKIAVDLAYEAAEQGMIRTIDMQSRHGRASRYLEKSIGHQDPGATVGALFFKGIARYMEPAR